MVQFRGSASVLDAFVGARPVSSITEGEVRVSEVVTAGSTGDVPGTVSDVG